MHCLALVKKGKITGSKCRHGRALPAWVNWASTPSIASPYMFMTRQPAVSHIVLEGKILGLAWPAFFESARCGCSSHGSKAAEAARALRPMGANNRELEVHLGSDQEVQLALTRAKRKKRKQKKRAILLAPTPCSHATKEQENNILFL